MMHGELSYVNYNIEQGKAKPIHSTVCNHLTSGVGTKQLSVLSHLGCVLAAGTLYSMLRMQYSMLRVFEIRFQN